MAERKARKANGGGFTPEESAAVVDEAPETGSASTAPGPTPPNEAPGEAAGAALAGVPAPEASPAIPSDLEAAIAALRESDPDAAARLEEAVAGPILTAEDLLEEPVAADVEGLESVVEAGMRAREIDRGATQGAAKRAFIALVNLNVGLGERRIGELVPEALLWDGNSLKAMIQTERLEPTFTEAEPDPLHEWIVADAPEFGTRDDAEAVARYEEFVRRYGEPVVALEPVPPPRNTKEAVLRAQAALSEIRDADERQREAEEARALAEADR